MKVELAIALPGNQRVFELDLEAGATVADALASLDIDTAQGAVGIFGTVVEPSRVLREGDRVEVYRPLQVDPKQARRRRADAKSRR